jgi:hypothetical protein
LPAIPAGTPSPSFTAGYRFWDTGSIYSSGAGQTSINSIRFGMSWVPARLKRLTLSGTVAALVDTVLPHQGRRGLRAGDAARAVTASRHGAPDPESLGVANAIPLAFPSGRPWGRSR